MDTELCALQRDLRTLSFMLITLMVIAVLYLAGLLVLAGAVLRAPEGFEDDEGFHQGRNALTDDLAL